MDDILIGFGSEVKAVGNGRVEGYLVRFGGPDDHDLVRDYFTKSTDFVIEDGARSPIYYGHGLDIKIGKRVLGFGQMKSDDVGVWFAGQMNLRDDYERAVYRMVEQKKIGFSSGTASHLVEREEVAASDGKKSYHITRWPLGLDASLTPTPCESKGTGVIGMKSWNTTENQDMLDISDELKSNSVDKQVPPADTTKQTLQDELDAALVAVAAVTDRSRSANDLRIKSGRVLSAATRSKLQGVHDALAELLVSTEVSAPAADPASETLSVDVSAVLSAWVSTEARLSGIDL